MTDTLLPMTQTPAETPTAPIEGTIDTQQTSVDEVRYIEFHGRQIGVLAPSTEQWALLIETQEWWRKNARAIAAVAGKLADAMEDNSNSPEARLARDGHRRIARLLTVIGALFADEDDYDWVQDEMGARRLKWTAFTDLPAAIAAVHRNPEDEPANREERRAAKRGGRAR